MKNPLFNKFFSEFKPHIYMGLIDLPNTFNNFQTDIEKVNSNNDKSSYNTCLDKLEYEVH